MKNFKQFLIGFLIVLLSASNVYSAKISELPEDTSVSGIDWTVVVDPSYTTTSKITLENFLEGAQQSKKVYYTKGAIATAVALIGSTECDLIIDKHETLATTLVVPVNIHLKGIKGAILTIPTTKKITAYKFSAGNYQVFSVTDPNSVAFEDGAVDFVKPEWFGDIAYYSSHKLISNASSGASNGLGGNKVRITTSSAHGYTTGMKIHIHNVTGTTEANGRWTITYIDTTNFDLDGSSYTNSYSTASPDYDFACRDFTNEVKYAINAAYPGGIPVSISPGTVWSYNSLVNLITGTVGVNSPTDIDLVSTEDLVGAFVWNITNGGYGIVSGQTSTTITTGPVELSTPDPDDYDIGDSYVISGLKVGVNIFDHSKYSESNSIKSGQICFTGQDKTFVNSPNPHNLSANENWVAYGQYHPASIVATEHDSEMESRASFIARRYKNGWLQNYVQFGLNPISDTDPTVNPSDASVWLVQGGHNGGVLTTAPSALVFFGGQMTDDKSGVYMSIGARPESGYLLYAYQDRNEDAKIKWKAESNKDVIHEFWNTTTGHLSNVFINGLTGNISIQNSLDANKITLGVDGSLTQIGSTGGYVVTIAEATGTPSGTTTYFDIAVAVPTGARLKGCQLRVDTALTAGETWKADFNGGSSTVIIGTGQAVAKDTKINKLIVDEITTNTTNVRVTRDSGNFTNGVGVIRAIVYYDTLTAMGNAP